MDDETILDQIRPRLKPRVIDLVRKAGLDTFEWGQYEGGQEKASSNPSYCYEWCFEQNGMIVLNIWFENMSIEDGVITQRLNMKGVAAHEVGIRRVRATRFDDAVRMGFETGSNPRVIILDRAKKGEGSANARLLDGSPWTIATYDCESGAFELVRGIANVVGSSLHDVELGEFEEGEARMRFTIHRRREAKLREGKLAQNKQKNDGRILCEVPGCGFDFELKYGELGKGYAQVHHLVPLSSLDHSGTGNTLDDVAVVCANCHVMIHRGGECRSLDHLVSDGS